MLPRLPAVAERIGGAPPLPGSRPGVTSLVIDPDGTTRATEIEDVVEFKDLRLKKTASGK